jgi:putative transposase
MSCGVARFAYNWGLAVKKAAWETDKTRLSDFDLVKIWNIWRKENAEWSYEVSKCSGQYAIHHLGTAFKGFFSGKGYPRFKKKGKSDSFVLGEKSAFKVEGKKIRLQKTGRIRLAEQIRFQGDHISATVSREADGWYVSVLVKTDHEFEQTKSESIVGIDLGVGNRVAVCSDGTELVNGRFYRKQEKKIKRLGRSLSKKKKGSKNREKARQKLSRAHQKARRRREHAINNFTTSVVKKHKYIGIETLNIKGMAKTKLAKSVHDAGMYEIRRQLEYKAKLRGCIIVNASRWYPSTKTCSNCGIVVDKLPLSVREWTCSGCGINHDRDLNAAKNLAALAEEFSESINDCGAERKQSCEAVNTNESRV